MSNRYERLPQEKIVRDSAAAIPWYINHPIQEIDEWIDPEQGSSNDALYEALRPIRADHGPWASGSVKHASFLLHDFYLAAGRYSKNDPVDEPQVVLGRFLDTVERKHTPAAREELMLKEDMSPAKKKELLAFTRDDIKPLLPLAHELKPPASNIVKWSLAIADQYLALNMEDTDDTALFTRADILYTAIKLRQELYSRDWRENFKRDVVALATARLTELCPGISPSAFAQRSEALRYTLIPDSGQDGMVKHEQSGGHYASLIREVSIPNRNAMSKQSGVHEVIHGLTHDFETDRTSFVDADVSGEVLKHLTEAVVEASTQTIIQPEEIEQANVYHTQRLMLDRLRTWSWSNDYGVSASARPGNETEDIPLPFFLNTLAGSSKDLRLALQQERGYSREDAERFMKFVEAAFTYCLSEDEVDSKKAFQLVRKHFVLLEAAVQSATKLSDQSVH